MRGFGKLIDDQRGNFILTEKNAGGKTMSKHYYVGTSDFLGDCAYTIKGNPVPGSDVTDDPEELISLPRYIPMRKLMAEFQRVADEHKDAEEIVIAFGWDQERDAGADDYFIWLEAHIYYREKPAETRKRVAKERKEQMLACSKEARYKEYLRLKEEFEGKSDVKK